MPDTQAAAPVAPPPTAPDAAKAKHGHAAVPAPRKVRFNVGTRYQVLDVIGEGTYGIVCSALHCPTGHKVAIKKIVPFDHSMFCLCTLCELNLLNLLSEAGVSENVRFPLTTWFTHLFPAQPQTRDCREVSTSALKFAYPLIARHMGTTEHF
ncbi:hypothetical protein K439DRAFT_1622779 [Ramaria rubella]|nr:hypothetical protein K439DRAFT_1622779 [Ramaria rubella]